MPPLSAGTQPRSEAAPVSLEPASSWEPQDADKDLRDSSPLFRGWCLTSPALERSLAHYTRCMDGLGNQGIIFFQTLMGKGLCSSQREAVTSLDATIKCGASSPRPVGWPPMGAALPLWGACHSRMLDGALCPCPAIPAASTVPAPHPAPRPSQPSPLHRRPPPST